MPRQRKPGNQGGYQPGQSPGGGSTELVPSMPYGQRQAETQALSAAPIPTGGGAPAPPPPGAPGTPPPAAPQVAGGNPMAAALQQAMMQGDMAQPGGLFRPTERPLEPVTTGLPTGPGQGPEALGQMPNPVVATLERISDQTGDPRMAEIAARARTLSGQ